MAGHEPFSLSVVIPTHAGRVSVATTVSALLSSSNSAGLEVVVVSDGDPSAAEAALAHVSDGRLRLVAQEKRGSASARNLGLSQAHFEWVAFVDDDDIPRPNWFSAWEENARSNLAVMTACAKHWQGKTVLHERRCCSLDMDDLTMGASRLLAGTFVARASALKAIGGYDLRLKASQNQDLGLRLLRHLEQSGECGAIQNIGETVIDLYTEDHARRKQRYGGARADAARLFQTRYSERVAADPRHAATLHRIIALAALEAGDMSEFRRSALAAFRTYPWARNNWRYAGAAMIPGAGNWLKKRLKS